MVMEESEEVLQLLRDVKRLSQRYRDLTGRPLGCTGEIAEFEAARILGLELSPVRQAGYDAVWQAADGEQRVQIKGRCILPGSSKGQRLGKIDTAKEWDSVLLVLLDECLEATAIYEADRADVVAALSAPGSKSRNQRGALGVSKFKSIGKLVWKNN